MILKWIALFSMTLDHIAYYMSPVFDGTTYTLFRTLGRLAFPIYAYLLVLGYERTRSLPRYMLRLWISGIIAQIPMYMYHTHTDEPMVVNVLFTLSMGLIVIFAFDLFVNAYLAVVGQLKPVGDQGLHSVKLKLKPIEQSPILGMILGGTIMLLCAILMYFIRSDYDYEGIMTILLFHIIHQAIQKHHTVEAATNIFSKQHPITLYLKTYLGLNLIWLIIRVFLQHQHPSSACMQIFSTAAVLFFPLESTGKPPKRLQTLFFYAYYPVHISILILLRFMIK